MTVLFVLTIAAFLLLILANYKTRSCSAEQQSESPCETCLRWSECNGVDEDCPLLRKEVK